MLGCPTVQGTAKRLPRSQASSSLLTCPIHRPGMQRHADTRIHSKLASKLLVAPHPLVTTSSKLLSATARHLPAPRSDGCTTAPAASPSGAAHVHTSAAAGAVSVANNMERGSGFTKRSMAAGHIAGRRGRPAPALCIRCRPLLRRLAALVTPPLPRLLPRLASFPDIPLLSCRSGSCSKLRQSRCL
jgi:hypothetical protein